MRGATLCATAHKLTKGVKELHNHHRNVTWVPIVASEVPRDRRIHKLVWVYKVKRDGSAKARLCVQGCTMVIGQDFDQVFAHTLRTSSVRTLFAYPHVSDVMFVVWIG